MVELENLFLQLLDGVFHVGSAVPPETLNRSRFAHVALGPTQLGSRRYNFDLLYGASDIPVIRKKHYSVPILSEGSINKKLKQWESIERLSGTESNIALIKGEDFYLIDRCNNMVLSYMYLHHSSVHPKYTLIKRLATELISKLRAQHVIFKADRQ